MLMLILAAVLAVAAIMAARLGWVWFNWRGDRLVTCPETRQPAGVAVDASRAAWTGIRHAPALHLHTCSRWPERQDCGQECLAQVEAAPEDCLVRNILAKWYEGKQCTVCGKPIGEIQWADHRPALLDQEGRTVAWTQVRPEKVPTALATCAPVCWNCHIVQTFCREHPDMVVDRHRSSRL